MIFDRNPGELGAHDDEEQGVLCIRQPAPRRAGLQRKAMAKVQWVCPYPRNVRMNAYAASCATMRRAPQHTKNAARCDNVITEQGLYNAMTPQCPLQLQDNYTCVASNNFPIQPRDRPHSDSIIWSIGICDGKACLRIGCT